MLAPWKKNYDQPRQHIKKQRDITLPTKVHLVTAMVFPVVMYGCESWTIKKPEHRRIDAFELWCWRTLESPSGCRRSNQSILKEISPEYSLEGLMLKLKLQYSAIWSVQMTHWKRPWGWERLKVGGQEDDRGWDGWMASPTQWTWVWVFRGGGDGQGGLACCSPRSSKESDMNEWLNWTELKNDIRLPSFPPCSSLCAHLSHILLTSCYTLVVVKTVLQKINSDLLEILNHRKLRS